MEKIIYGAIIIAIGILVGNMGLGIAEVTETPFSNEYPVNGEWANSGTHNNTFTNAQGQLVIDDTTGQIATGSFISDRISEEETLNINSMGYDASNLIDQGSTVRSIEIEVRGVRDNIIRDTVMFTAENGLNAVSVENLSDQDYDSYEYVINMRTEEYDSGTPQLDMLKISGSSYGGDNLSGGLSTALQWLLIFIGMMIILKEVW